MFSLAGSVPWIVIGSCYHVTRNMAKRVRGSTLLDAWLKKPRRNGNYVLNAYFGCHPVDRNNKVIVT